MAKFTNKDLRLKDGQKVTWGTDLDSNIWWDDANQELRLDTVISGVMPTKPMHLTPRFYVDQEIATLSGSIVLDHGNLTGLGDDDHTQYILVDGSRGFTSTVSGVTPVQDFHLATKWYIDNELATLSGGIVQNHGNLLGLDQDDHTQYILVDGSRGFTSTVSGVDPTQGFHLTTKDYVDTEITNNVITDHGGLSGLGDDDHTQYILVDGSRGFTGTVSGIDPTEAAHLTTKNYVDMAISGLDWQDSVINFAPVASGVQSTGNRYIANATGGGWTTDNIYEWDGSAWDETVPNEGFATWVEAEDRLYVYNGTSWVPFGATVTHNNLSGLQGGTTGEYYHLTSDQRSSLTSVGGVEDASDMHTHDDRYYTETEIDTTLSGYAPISHTHPSTDVTDFTEAAQDAVGNIMTGAGFVTVTYDDGTPQIVVSGTTSAIDHGGLSGLGDDDHTQYSLVDGSRAFTSTVGGVTPTADAHLTTKQYVDDEIATLSGIVANLEHHDLGGLTDDDHPQYILVDGSRGFTATVSGVTPTQGYHLATKDYVDQNDEPQLHGRQAIADQASTVTVNFTDVGSTNYTVNATMENTSDSPPSIYAFIVSAKTSSSFTVTFMGDMDSANYLLDWMVIPD
jgi:hypothetical protein